MNDRKSIKVMVKMRPRVALVGGRAARRGDLPHPGQHFLNYFLGARGC
jgi:hypothetical protein